MPELPEVETTRRGLAPHLVGRTIVGAVVRDARLRWPVPEGLPGILHGRRVAALARRGKYLLLAAGDGTLILHLGMSGSLRMVPAGTPAAPHEHFDLVLDSGQAVRLRDPRRFGAVLWAEGAAAAHPLLARLGVEPLQQRFSGAYLYRATRGRRVAVKQLLMDSHTVVGVGNIYASEALFAAGIRPSMPAHRLGPQRCEDLAAAVKATLRRAIRAGGSTLRDFVGSDGEPGHFQFDFLVYDREGQPCPRCGAPIRRRVHGQRSTYYCARCQK